MPRSISVTELRERLEGAEAPVVLDVRRAPAFADSPSLIPGATRLEPEAVDAWAAELPKDRPVVAYCVLGHQVSQGVVARLEQLGVGAGCAGPAISPGSTSRTTSAARGAGRGATSSAGSRCWR